MEEATANKGTALISVAAVVVIVYGMQAASVLLVPFLLAVFLALITIRPMLWLQSKRVPAFLATLAIVVALMLIIGTIGGIVGNSIADFTATLPGYQERLTTILQSTATFVVERFGDEGDEVPNFADFVNPGFAMGFVATMLNALREVLTNTFLILFTMVFILLEASSMAVKAEAAFGRSAESFEGPRHYINNLGRYLGIKTVVSIATGFAAWVVTLSIGLDFPLLWGMLAFLLNYVPTIGSIIAAVPAVLFALVQLGIGEATTTAIGFFAINVFFGNLVEPRLMGYGVGISPLIVFTGLVLWGWIFGPVGMLLSVPLTMSLKMALESNEDTRWIAILIGSERDAEYALGQRVRDEENEE